jgi:hypothetical protein
MAKETPAREGVAICLAFSTGLIVLSAIWISSAYLWTVSPPVKFERPDGGVMVAMATIFGGLALSIGLGLVVGQITSIALAMFFDENLDRLPPREVRFDHPNKKAG